MRDEPRGFTTGDRVAVGVGLVLGFLSLPLWVAIAANGPWMGVGIFKRNSLGFWLAAVILSVVAVGRTGQFGRLPRPAEWLALTLFAWGAATLLPPASHEELTTLVLRPLTFLNLSHPVGRWVACGLITAVILLGWSIVRLGRSTLPTAVQTVWLTFLIFLTIWSPLTTLGLHAADWFAPADGFGRGVAMVLYRGVCQWLAQTPLALLIGWPVVAAIEERLQGRRWHWNETAAALAAVLAGLLASVVFRGEFSPLSLPGLAERIIAAGWLGGVAWLDLLLIRRARRAEVEANDEATLARSPEWSRGEPSAAGTTRRD